MGFLDALFAGARALVREVVQVGRLVIREVLEELDRSAIGQAATRVIHGFADRAFSQAKDLADEERELAEKLRRDGRRSAADDDRVREIHQERERLRKLVEEQTAAAAAAELKGRAEELGAYRVDDDEVSFNASILSTKKCSCGGVMTIRQAPLDAVTQARKFYWQCTDTSRRNQCKRIYFDPSKEQSTVLRPADVELDMPKTTRRDAWRRPDVIQQAHIRLRQHLDDEDQKVICPHHVLPMRLLQRRGAGGRLLDSYEYVCLGVHESGMSCSYTVPVVTMPQVSSILHRTEGEGILSS